MKLKILVTGANGFVGSHLTEKLLELGHEVYALVRNPKKFSVSSHDRLFVIQGDLDNDILTWKDKLPADLTTCVHTAGIVHSYLPDEFFRVNAVGTENLVNNLKAKYTSLHFVLISSLAAAGPSLGDHQRNEEDLDLPVSVYGQSKKEAEEVLRRLAPHFQIAIIRPPMVIGPRDSAVLDIFKMVKGSVVLLPGIGSKDKLYSFVCVFDLVNTIVKIIEGQTTSLYYSAYPEVIRFEQIIEEIKKQLKKKWIFYLPLPLFLVRLLSTILNFFYRLFPHSLRLTPDKYFELAATNWTCDSKKSQELLGQEYNYNLERTIAVTLEDYRSRNWI